MKIQLCDKRKEIIAREGHLLVLGGPGSGKTTVALLKAQRRFQTLLPGQKILFLSFSRAAVRQVLLRCKEILTPAERRAVTVKTYHSFCLEMLESHGRLLRGAPVTFIYPGDERLPKIGVWRRLGGGAKPSCHRRKPVLLRSFRGRDSDAAGALRGSQSSHRKQVSADYRRSSFWTLNNDQ